jgi:hypothetical protein
MQFLSLFVIEKSLSKNQDTLDFFFAISLSNENKIAKQIVSRH